jgi:hypothetical protein
MSSEDALSTRYRNPKRRKKPMIRLIVIVSIISVGTYVPTWAQCTDRTMARVSPKYGLMGGDYLDQVTISDLLKEQPPDSVSIYTPRMEIEEHTVILECHIVKHSYEHTPSGPQTLVLILADDSGNTIRAEIPDPSCNCIQITPYQKKILQRFLGDSSFKKDYEEDTALKQSYRLHRSYCESYFRSAEYKNGNMKFVIGGFRFWQPAKPPKRSQMIISPIIHIESARDN